MRPLLVILLLAVAACGGQDPAAENRTGKSDRDREILVPGGRVTTGGSPGNTGVAKAGTGDPDLRLSARPPSTGFMPGRPFIVILKLRNVSRYTFQMFRPKETLRSDLNCLILRANGTKDLIRDEWRVPAEELGPTRLTDFPPGTEIVVQKDLEPTLSRLTAGRAGTYRVQVAFTGGHHGSEFSDRVWNRLHMKRVLAEPFEIRIAAGGPPTEDEVVRILSETGPDGRLPASVRRKLLDGGPSVWPALVRALSLADSALSDEQSAGWAAFQVLREIGAPAHAALAAAEENGAIHRMLALWMEIDAATEGVEPPGAAFADVVLDPSTRASQIFRMTRHAKPGMSDTVSVYGDGKVVRHVIDPGGDGAFRGRMSGKATDRFLETLLEGAFWEQTGVRTAGREGEALLVFEWLSFEEFDGVWAETPVRRFQVWESEAWLNEPLHRIVGAFERAREVAR